MPTLGELRDYGARLTIYCHTLNPKRCGNSWEPSMDQMVQYFGVDFDPAEQRQEMLRRLICEKCGQRDVATIWHPPADTPGMMRGMRSHDHSDTRTPEQKAQDRHDAIEIPKMVAQHLAWVKEQRRRNRAAEKAKRDREAGRDPIGPPNPWAHRKGRWL